MSTHVFIALYLAVFVIALASQSMYRHLKKTKPIPVPRAHGHYKKERI